MRYIINNVLFNKANRECFAVHTYVDKPLVEFCDFVLFLHAMHIYISCTVLKYVKSPMFTVEL